MPKIVVFGTIFSLKIGVLLGEYFRDMIGKYHPSSHENVINFSLCWILLHVQHTVFKVMYHSHAMCHVTSAALIL